MAHGGSPAWNEHVAQAVAPLAADVPTAVAYGMADPFTLAAALDSLGDEGVHRVALVRMFLSGESFSGQANYYLGLSETPPETFVLMGPVADDPAARTPIQHSMSVATHRDGLLRSNEAREIMVDRAMALSSSPAQESVLIIAHGMGDEEENDRVLAAMRSAADLIRGRGFAEVKVATLREDWAEARAISEVQIRRFVRDETAVGRKVIALPMRLSGFGPYADVLAGLDYRSGEGLLPHEAIADWVHDTAAEVACAAGWGSVLGPCTAVGEDRSTRTPGGVFPMASRWPTPTP